MTPEATAILNVFRSRKLGSGAFIHVTDFGDALVWEAGSIKDERSREALKYLTENGYLIEMVDGSEQLTEKGAESAATHGVETGLAFGLEAQLRDFIAHNIGSIRIGGRTLRLYVDASGRNGIEYPTDVGPIDILAVDEADRFVVFELKLERGPDRALGQLARYMGWVHAHLSPKADVSGVIVARTIDERLRYAVGVMPRVTLLEYEVSFQLREASPILGSTQ